MEKHELKLPVFQGDIDNDLIENCFYFKMYICNEKENTLIIKEGSKTLWKIIKKNILFNKIFNKLINDCIYKWDIIKSKSLRH